MSVQVRRRREAAAFLQTYVGAQAELLVDTTNNRVQVHDGTTAGGWPAARLADLGGRNLIINGNFAINQRAYASGTAMAAVQYGHDRWRDATNGNGNTSYTFTQGACDTTITVTAGQINQIVEGGNVEGGTYVLSWVGSLPMTVAFTNSSGQNQAVSSSTSPLLVPNVGAGSTILVLSDGTGTLGLVQLEPGTTPTPFRRVTAAIALGNCQRYFITTYPQGTAPGTPNAPAALAPFLQNAGSYQTLATLTLPVTMRATPTFTIYSPNSGAAGNIYCNNLGKDVTAYAAGLSASCVTIANLASAQYGCQLNFTASAEL